MIDPEMIGEAMHRLIADLYPTSRDAYGTAMAAVAAVRRATSHGPSARRKSTSRWWRPLKSGSTRDGP
jgi:hypothetical protein